MQKQCTIDQANQLIELGKEKGFLTYEEVNDILPSDIFSPNQIDEMLVMFGEMNIEIGEVAKKASVPKHKLQEIPGKGNGEIKEAPGKAAFDNFNDPARIYLREMGAVSLLSREEEVEITIREIVNMGESLRLNKLSVREVVRGLDDEETVVDEEQHKRNVLSLIGRIARREQKNLEIRKQLTQTALGKARKIELQKKADRGAEKVLDLIEQINFNKAQIERVAQKLKHFLERLGEAEGEISQCAEKAKIPLEELKKLFRQARKSHHEEKMIAKKTGISKKVLLEYEGVIKSARKKIKRIEAESTFGVQSLKKAVKG